jgi:dihydroorotate dehydrogenase
MSGAPDPRALPAPAPEVLGLCFASRLGLAAGMDKNAEILEHLPALGFGFAEVGTVTPRPQPGNDRPRLFRDASRAAVFNRMGFNNEGAEAVAKRVAEARARLPGHFRVGVNIGKNKDTPLEDAARDYAAAARPFAGLADYVVINVSSPNTPGLRSLQNVESLRALAESVQVILNGWARRPPLLLKLAPELGPDELREILVRGETEWGVEGWVLTNTLAGTWSRGIAAPLPGGWSGMPVAEHSRRALGLARAVARRPIISVGGILTPGQAKERIAMGADLIQIYSGWILGGPRLPARIRAEIDEK